MIWNRTFYGPGLERTIPKISGIYIIAEVRHYANLPLQIMPTYIGKSKNLRRRWIEHASRHESNPKLYGLADDLEYEFWWAAVSENEISSVEADLILKLDPPANRRGRKKECGIATAKSLL